MIKFEPRYFKKFSFKKEQIKKYLKNALNDLEIAKENKRSEVKFSYSYNALIKGGITILASHNIKVRSVPGHHVKIIEKISKILSDKSIQNIGNVMRMKRNMDLYDGGILVSKKESIDFYNFTKEILDKISQYISDSNFR